MALLTEQRFGRPDLKHQFQSKGIDFETPLGLFKRLDAEFHFSVDLAASPSNTKCSTYYTKEDNALVKDWSGTCWLNPPYNRDLAKWVKKAFDSAKWNGATIVCLIPARTNTNWWHDYCMKAEMRFIRGRPKFNGPVGLPWPLAIVIFRPNGNVGIGSFAI